MASKQRNHKSAFKKYETKPIQFLGLTTPIILQHDYDYHNDNGPSPLVAICNVLLLRNDLNLNTDAYKVSQTTLISLLVEQLKNKYLASDDENQRRIISDAAVLISSLATRVDVNIKFGRINDFEFTPEFAIFDLLDIPLYHGVIVDPQDSVTYRAIGDRSYNALMEELAALDARNVETECKRNSVDSSTDFADYQIIRKGDVEEQEQLARVLKLSKVEFRTSPVGSIGKLSSSCYTEDVMETADCNASSIVNIESFEIVSFDEVTLSSISDEGNHANQPSSADLADPLQSIGIDNTDSYVLVTKDCDSNDVSQMATVDTLSEISSLSPPDADVDSSSGESHHELNDNMFEEEECISDYGIDDIVSRESIYQHNPAGEETLAEDTLNELTPYQGALIRNFLKMNERQLSLYSLFCLQDGLKERELCVFFHNNHFRTMLKYGGELYLLVTNEGYIDRLDIVWEKLYPVVGNTSFVNGYFEIWRDEYNVFTSTSDYLATIDKSANAVSDFNIELELAIALQQEEFEEQPWS